MKANQGTKMTNARKKIPYGISSYKTIRRENCYYVDKTRFIPQFEQAGKYLFLLRPRRFGKSSLLTLLECYYDIAKKDEFEFLFKGTEIGEHPTPEKNSHLILKFNFSQVNPAPDKVEESFREHVETRMFFFGENYRDYLDDIYFKTMDRKKSPQGKLEFLLSYVGSKDRKVYVVIDEYDNFANTVLSTAGQEKYRELTHGAGFLRFFFNVLKGAGDLADSGLGRMFIAGVSPVTMDDVTSGFNIGRNVSLNPNFNEALGFTKDDVCQMMAYYGLPAADSEQIAETIEEWYGNYRFSDLSETAIFNTDMVLYFLVHYLESGKPPAEMIDQNVRVDYGKLRHLVVLNRRLNGNFGRLEEIVESQGVEGAKIAESFPMERLLKKTEGCKTTRFCMQRRLDMLNTELAERIREASVSEQIEILELILRSLKSKIEPERKAPANRSNLLR
jgi:hypothetical protein